jgi:hypothetical protein
MRTRTSIRTTLVTAGVGVAAGLALAPTTVQAAINYFDTTKVVTSTSGSVSCPSGWRLTGGGAGPLPSDRYSSLSSDEYQLTDSYPSSNGWRASATRVHGTYYSSSGWKFSTYTYRAKVYAVCAS